MRRAVWVAIGAVGGIVAYRRIEQAMADARERGVVLSVQQMGLSTVQAITTARTMAAGAVNEVRAHQANPSAMPGSAAASVLRQSQQGEM